MSRKRTRRSKSTETQTAQSAQSARAAQTALTSAVADTEPSVSHAHAVEGKELPVVVRACFSALFAFVACLVSVAALQVLSRVAIATMTGLAETGDVNADDLVVMLSALLGGVGAGALLLIPKTYAAMKALFYGALGVLRKLIDRGSRKLDSDSRTTKTRRHSRCTHCKDAAENDGCDVARDGVTSPFVDTVK